LGPSSLTSGGLRVASLLIFAQSVMSPQNCGCVSRAAANAKISDGVLEPERIASRASCSSRPNPVASSGCSCSQRVTAAGIHGNGAPIVNKKRNDRGNACDHTIYNNRNQSIGHAISILWIIGWIIHILWKMVKRYFQEELTTPSFTQIQRSFYSSIFLGYSISYAQRCQSFLIHDLLCTGHFGILCILYSPPHFSLTP
jgi:hypothetical protein